MQPPALTYKDHATASTPPTDFVITDLADYHVTILVGLITLLIAYLLLILIFQRHSGLQNGLVLELTTGPKCVTVPILSLTLCPACWDIQAPYAVDNLVFQDTFFPLCQLIEQTLW